MLNQEQSREYNRAKKLQVFLGKNTAVYAGFLPFAGENDDFNTNVATFDDLIPDKNNIGNGITTDKTGIKREVSDMLALMLKKTYAYALKYNNSELAAEVNITSDRIFRLKDSDIQGYTEDMTKIMTPLLDDADYQTYGVTKDALDAVVKKAVLFDSLIGKADEKDSENTVASTKINKVIVLLHGNVKQFDLLVDEFADDNPGFVQGYHINSEVQESGVRHSGIEGYVRAKDGSPVAGAVVRLEGTTKTAVTDLKGFYHLERAQPGDYMVTCTADGYAPQRLLHHISRGKTDEMDWVMA